MRKENRGRTAVHKKRNFRNEPCSPGIIRRRAAIPQAGGGAPVAPMTAARLILWWLQHRPQAQAVDFPLSSSCQGYMPILWQGTLLQLHWNYMAPLTASDLELTRMGIQRIVIKHHPTRNGNAHPIANRKKEVFESKCIPIQHMNAIYRWWMTSHWELTPIRSEWFCCDVSAPRTSLWAHAVCQISLARKFPVLDTRCISGFRAKRSLPKKEVRKAVTTVL